MNILCLSRELRGVYGAACDYLRNCDGVGEGAWTRTGVVDNDL